MISDFERRVDDGSIEETVRRAEDAAGAEEGVAADGDGGVVGRRKRRRAFCIGSRVRGRSGSGRRGSIGRSRKGAQVAADADKRGNDGAAGEEDVLGAVELGAAGDFVAGFGLEVVAAEGGAGFGGHIGLVWVRRGAVLEYCCISVR